MKNFVLTLIIIAIVAIVGIGGYFGWQWLSGRGEFLWGITMRPHAVGDWNKKNWGKQMDLAKNLGVNSARITWQHDAYYKGDADPFAFHDALLESLQESNMKMLLVIEPNPKGGITDYYQEGLKDGENIASYYKGKIKYYQMMNEGGAQTIKNPTAGGQKENEYDEAKYEIVKNYMRGLSEGIHKADRRAVRIVTVSWTHTGFLDKIVKDGIDFDWVGLDWYHWMGPIEEKKMDDGTLYVDKLKSYDKPLVFIEVNAWPKKNQVDAQAQTDFIQKTAEWAWSNQSWVRGFFVFELMDNVNVANDNGEHFGLVEAIKVKANDFDIEEPRASYAAYQEIIKKFAK